MGLNLASVYIVPRSKNLKATEIGITEKTTLTDILNHISVVNKRISRNRLRLSYKKEDKQIPILKEDFFKDAPLSNIDQLYVKDLGPQINYRLCFLIEYIGPIIVHSIVYHLSKIPSIREKFANPNAGYSPTWNKMLYILILLHYGKRELESLFVHSFSNSTMPLFNVFKNSFHYWILNGSISLAYFGWGFIFSDDFIFNLYDKLVVTDIGLLLAFFTISEIFNFVVHVRLRKWGDLQKAKGNTSKRVALDEGLFKIFVAPNYTFEIYAWTVFAIIAKLNIFALIFLTVSTVQMYLWAIKKNKKYGTKKAFLIPYIF